MRTIIKGLVAALVVAVPAIASAAPCNDAPVTVGTVSTAPVYTVTANPPIVVTQPVITRKPVITHPIIVLKHQGWVDLSGGIKLRGADTVAVGLQQGEFKTIELVRDSGRGETKVQDVTITYGNGQTQTICVDKMLSPRDKSVQIDLAGNYRYIRSVSITGKSIDHGSIQLRAV